MGRWTFLASWSFARLAACPEIGASSPYLGQEDSSAARSCPLERSGVNCPRELFSGARRTCRISA
jgi:hypothetical protein